MRFLIGFLGVVFLSLIACQASSWGAGSASHPAAAPATDLGVSKDATGSDTPFFASSTAAKSSPTSDSNPTSSPLPASTSNAQISRYRLSLHRQHATDVGLR